MRRRLFITLLVLLIAVLGIRQLTQKPSSLGEPNGSRIQFVEFGPLPPESNVSLASLQNSIDRVSEAALQGRWTSASREVQQLERLWNSVRTGGTERLEIEQSITNGIQTLYYNVLGRDEKGVLITGQKLTGFVSQLSQ